MQIVILGGGAAGMAAAIAAAEAGAQVTVLERNAKPLKKLGVTGNGRGNILNGGPPLYYGDPAFAKAALDQIGFQELTAFFTGLGVPLREEGEGLYYPACLQASAVVDALLLRAAQLGVAVRCGCLVESLQSEPGGFTIAARQGESGQTVTLHADRVIAACGGAAYPVHGTDGTAYSLLTALSHTVTEQKPALCALLAPKKRLEGLAGQRVRVRLRLLDVGGAALQASRGEALFAENAVSGIAAMQLARFYEEGAMLSLDLRDELNHSQEPLAFLQSLAAMRRERPAADLLTGALAWPVARFVLREAGIRDVRVPIGSLPENALRRIAAALSEIRLPVTGTRGFANAQVTAGGLHTDAFNPATMESRLVPGLYAAGEMLNVDGTCGGYNLMFAFASGIIAGRAACA